MSARETGWSTYQSGDLVAVADVDAVVVNDQREDDPWIEVVTNDAGAVGFTVHESEIHS